MLKTSTIMYQVFSLCFSLTTDLNTYIHLFIQQKLVIIYVSNMLLELKKQRWTKHLTYTQVLRKKNIEQKNYNAVS